MRTSRPDAGRRQSGAQVAGVGGELAEQLEHPLGPVDHDVGERLEACSPPPRPRRPAASGMPLLAQLLDRLERLDVARGRRRRRGTPRRSSSRTSVSTTQRPCACPGERTSMTLRPGSTVRSWRRAGSRTSGSSRSKARPGVGQPTGVHGDGEALLLDVGVGRVGLPQQPGQLAQERRQPVRRPRRDHPAVRWRTSARCRTGRTRRAPCRRPRWRCRPPRARRGRAPAGPGRPVITAIARTWVARSTSTSRGLGVDVGRRRGRRRSGTGCRRSRARPRRLAAARTSAAYRCSPSAEANSMGDTSNHERGAVGRAGRDGPGVSPEW